MKEQVFRQLVDTYMKENRKRSPLSNEMLIVLKTRYSFQQTLYEMGELDQSQYIDCMRGEVHENFQRVANTIRKVAANPQLDQTLRAEHFFRLHEGKHGTEWIDIFNENVHEIDASFSFPNVAHENLDKMHQIWQDMTKGQLGHSYLVCIQWDNDNYPDGRSTIINVYDYVMNVMVA